MGKFKTPGVYIEEIPHLPPSIVSVETAIPAFIGYTEKADVYTNLAEATIFIQNTTPFDEIIQNMVQVKKLEKPFKEQIKFLLEDSLYEGHIDDEIRAVFEEYLSKDWKYFGNNVYFNQEVDVLFSAMFNFSVVVFKLHFKLKKSLLEFQASVLVNSKSLSKVDI